MFHETLNALLLDELQELVFCLAPFLLRHFARQPLQLNGTRIALRVDGMADAVDESRLVVSLLAQHAFQVGIYFVGRCPVAYLLFQMMEHLDDLNVCSAVERALQRADARGDATIGVGARRTGHTHRERRVVTATMLGLHDEQ